MFSPPAPSRVPIPPSWELHVSPTPKDGAVDSRYEDPQYWAAYGFSLKDIVSTLWDLRENRIFEAADIGSKRLYDFVFVPPRPLAEDEKLTALRKGVESRFGVRIVHAKRAMEVYVLSAPHGKSPALRELQLSTTQGQIVGTGLGGSDRELSGSNVRMDDLCETVERFKRSVVVDETNLSGRYSFDVKGNGLDSMLEEQLGLVLSKGRRQVDVLLIQKN